MEGSLITVVLTIAAAAGMIGSMLIASWLAPRFLGSGWSKVKPDITPYECGSRPFAAVDKELDFLFQALAPKIVDPASVERRARGGLSMGRSERGKEQYSGCHRADSRQIPAT